MRLQDIKAQLLAHRIALLAVLVVAAAAAWAAPRLLQGPEITVARILRRDFAQSVVASGHVEAPHRASIAAVLTGKVLRVPVAEGQAVAAGQVLVQLDDREWRAAAAQADAGVDQAQARVHQLREVDFPVADQAVREAEVTLRNARQQRERSAELLKQGFIGPSAMDDADKAVDVAQAHWQSAAAQRVGALPSGAATKIAEAALQQARAAAAAAHSRLAYATIVAPVAGTLIARNVEPGDVAQAGQLLMTLSPAGATQIVVDIDERNMHLLALGQAARASADAFADQMFEARIAYINPGVDLQRGTVEVKLDVPATPAFLRQDMTVSVDIQVATRAHAVLVPLDAVHDARGAQPWSLVLVDHHLQRRALRLGLIGSGYAEVLDGLAEGDSVASASLAVVAGSRVRVRGAPA